MDHTARGRHGKTNNTDLSWAAPGSRRGYFGVVTRIWVRTIPARNFFDTSLIIELTDVFKLKSVLEISEKVPKYGVDLFLLTFRSDIDKPGDGNASDPHCVVF